MSKHALNKNIMSRHYDMVILNFNVVIGATGAVGTVKGAGITSITRTDVGEYAVLLDDQYNRLLFSSAGMLSDTFSDVVAIEMKGVATVQAAIQAGTAITFQCYDKAGAAVDPASGSVISGLIFVRRTSLQAGGE